MGIALSALHPEAGSILTLVRERGVACVQWTGGGPAKPVTGMRAGFAVTAETMAHASHPVSFLVLPVEGANTLAQAVEAWQPGDLLLQPPASMAMEDLLKHVDEAMQLLGRAVHVQLDLTACDSPLRWIRACAPLLRGLVIPLNDSIRWVPEQCCNALFAGRGKACTVFLRAEETDGPDAVAQAFERWNPAIRASSIRAE